MKHHHLYNNFKWASIAKNRFPRVLLVADKSYWDYWFNRILKILNECFRILRGNKEKTCFLLFIKYFYAMCGVKIK